MKEYMPGVMGAAYMSFIVDKLKPFIDSTYRTMQDRDNTLVGGSSAGGICSFMLVWDFFQSHLYVTSFYSFRAQNYSRMA